ncbi:MAG: EamA family transporter RarD [Clostridiales Family XIII bacterium]|nr:EamA family transporter RarD [Clostridiales Family XIII bacterium]
MKNKGLSGLTRDQKIGGGISVFTYLLWGILPVYWSLLDSVPAETVMALRVVWTLLVTAAIIFANGSWRKAFVKEAKEIFHRPKKLLIVFTCAFLLAANWLIFIWAIGSGFVVDVSLAYFINPLLNFVLAVAFLKEKATRTGVAAVALALIGVAVMAVYTGFIPWISIVIAAAFAFYGLLKKFLVYQAYTGFMLEVAIMLPFAIVFLSLFSGDRPITSIGSWLHFLIALSGPLTAIPMMLFAESTRRISYIAIGFYQYLSPTCTFLLAIFYYGEVISPIRLLGFVFIWAGIAVFCAGAVHDLRRAT